MPPIPSIPETSTPPLARLQRLARPRIVQERCEICSAAIPEEHQHLLELKTRQLQCTCDACAVLFTDRANPRFLRVPRRIQKIDDFDPTNQHWDSLHLPINLAFFYRNSHDNKIAAMYPSPGGATESLLPTQVWEELAAATPALQNMQPDVEAVLVNRLGSRNDCFLVSIDECYRLVGIIRTHWQGLSGGLDVWRAINDFFEALNHHETHSGGARRA